MAVEQPRARIVVPPGKENPATGGNEDDVAAEVTRAGADVALCVDNFEGGIAFTEENKVMSVEMERVGHVQDGAVGNGKVGHQETVGPAIVAHLVEAGVVDGKGVIPLGFTVVPVVDHWLSPVGEVKWLMADGPATGVSTNVAVVSSGGNANSKGTNVLLDRRRNIHGDNGVENGVKLSLFPGGSNKSNLLGGVHLGVNNAGEIVAEDSKSFVQMLLNLGDILGDVNSHPVVSVGILRTSTLRVVNDDSVPLTDSHVDNLHPFRMDGNKVGRNNRKPANISFCTILFNCGIGHTYASQSETGSGLRRMH